MDDWERSQYGAKADSLTMIASRPKDPRDTDEYRAMAAEREAEYLLSERLYQDLGVEPEPEFGRGHYGAACADLRKRGIDPDGCDADTLLDALNRTAA